MINLDFGFGPVEAEFWRWLFVMTRIGAAMLAAPFFGAGSVPPQARVVVTGAIAVLVCAWTPVQAPPALLSANGILMVAGEVLVGLSLGGYASLAYAGRYGERVAGVMLSGCSAEIKGKPVGLFRRVASQQNAIPNNDSSAFWHDDLASPVLWPTQIHVNLARTPQFLLRPAQVGDHQFPLRRRVMRAVNSGAVHAVV